jgi:hypothetical protein
LNQIQLWGSGLSFGFAEEPAANGAAQRLNRSLREQVIHGRVCRNREKVHAAAAELVGRHN